MPRQKLTPSDIGGRCQFFPNPAIGHHAQEFETTRPRDGPGRGTLREFGHNRKGGLPPRALAAVGVNQNVGVDGDQFESVPP